MTKILVTGTHRSGSTWVGKMLSLNKDVNYVQEPFNIDHHSKQLGLSLTKWFSYIPDLENQEEFYQAFAKILSFRRFQQYPNQTWHKNLTNKLKGFHRRRTNQSILIKDPLALLSAELLAQKFDMKVVCLVRHPLAYCGSIKKWSWDFPFNHFLGQEKLINSKFKDNKTEIKRFATEVHPILDQAILLWNLLHSVIKQYQENNPNWIFIKHEEVVQNPLETFEAIYQKLGLKFDNQVQTKITNSLNSKEGETKDVKFKARDKNQVINTWKERLTEEEQKRIIDKTTTLTNHFYPQS